MSSYGLICPEYNNGAFILGGKRYDFIIAGGGASGLMAAGRAAELGLKVLILEKMKRPAVKLSITGKGRCNVTNSAPLAEFIKKIKPDGRFLRQVFNRFFSDDVVGFFENRGVKIKLERGGRYFPESDKAQDIVKALLKYCEHDLIDIRTQAKVEKMIIENGQVSGVTYKDLASNKIIEVKCENVLVAVGGDCYHSTGTTGDGYKIAKDAGHKIEKIFPALVPVELDFKYQKEIEGLHLKNINLSLWNDRKKLDEEFGECEFNKKGVTGPIVLKLSRNVAELIGKGENLHFKLDFKPALDDKKMDNRLIREIEKINKGRVYDMLKSLMPLQLIDICAKMTGLNTDGRCSDLNGEQRKKLRLWLKSMELKIKDVFPINEAIVTAGGINLKEVNPKTMESKLVSGLYFSGEILNIDADTGGYNLQAAFSTGFVAAESVREKIG